jgi:hypothetical protein
MRIAALSLLLLLAAALGATQAHAGGGYYRIDGGTAREQAQVSAALAASSFDWDVVPTQIVVHLVRGVESHSTPGHVWLDTDLLRSGSFSWAVIQDEFAHQLDFLLFDDATRTKLTTALGGKAWCHSARPGLRHDEYGCERFASTLVWSFWPSRENAYRPRGSGDESAAMAPGRFRALVGTLVSQRLNALGIAR